MVSRLITAFCILQWGVSSSHAFFSSSNDSVNYKVLPRKCSFSSCQQRYCQKSQRISVYLQGMNMEDDDFDIETARSQLENMIGEDGNSSRSRTSRKYSSTDYKPLTSALLLDQSPPIQTDEQRKHQAKEIELLSSLYQCDDESVLTELWTHWFAERGPGPAADLLQAEQLANMGDDRIYQKEAEKMFRKLIKTHGIYWAEPVNRLATLLYRQGRYEESKACCELVLAVKPWHFGALSGIVMVCAGMNDSVNAKIWADRRLPPLQPNENGKFNPSGNERRKDWIRRAVRDATNFLFRPQVDMVEFDDEVRDGIYSDDFDDSWQ